VHKKIGRAITANAGRPERILIKVPSQDGRMIDEEKSADGDIGVPREARRTEV
jgi:hypothetical protein